LVVPDTTTASVTKDVLSRYEEQDT
jgi:hypothetical protein